MLSKNWCTGRKGWKKKGHIEREGKQRGRERQREGEGERVAGAADRQCEAGGSAAERCCRQGRECCAMWCLATCCLDLVGLVLAQLGSLWPSWAHLGPVQDMGIIRAH